MTMNSNLHPKDAHATLFGKRVAARLSESSDSLPHDVLERLKAGRIHALQMRKVVSAKTATANSWFGRGTALQLGRHHGDGWGHLASLIPLLALVMGLMAISVLQDEHLTQELADVDAELLTDDLPPSAYTDPGFTQFLHLRQGD